MTKFQDNLSQETVPSQKNSGRLFGNVIRFLGDIFKPEYAPKQGIPPSASVAASLPAAIPPIHRFRQLPPFSAPRSFRTTTSSLTILKNSLYLATIEYAPDRLEEIRQVLRYDSSSDQWTVIYEQQLPAVLEKFLSAAEDAGKTPRSYTLASEITSLNGKLYVGFYSSEHIQVLKSLDGHTFEVISNAKPVQKILAVNNHAYALPTRDMDKLYGQLGNAGLVYVGENSSESMVWQPANLPGFSQTDNQQVTELAVFENALYAGTLNPTGGFQLWKTDADGQPPYSWERVLDKGAYGYTLNQIVTSLATFKGNLYIASSIPKVGINQSLGFYWAGVEIYRVYPNNDWDLIVGTPKYTPQGLKIPLSVMGPGFDSPPESPTSSVLVVHNDRLYASAQNLDGFNLWVTEDGEQWNPIHVEDLSGDYRVDVLQAISTPLGLVMLVERCNSLGEGEVQIWCGE